MRRLAVVLLIAIIGVFLVPPAASAGQVLFSDNFNDGNANGWWFAPTGTTPYWRVENGVLLSPIGDQRALVEALTLSKQSIETSLRLNREIFGSFGGVTLWYEDAANYVSLVVYPAEGSITVYEFLDGEASISHYGGRTWLDQWYRLRVDADGLTGAMAIYRDDVYQGTHYAVTPNRSGLSGLSTGNGSAEFDDLSIESVPDPGSSLLLFGMGVAGLTAFRRRRG